MENPGFYDVSDDKPPPYDPGGTLYDILFIGSLCLSAFIAHVEVAAPAIL